MQQDGLQSNGWPQSDVRLVLDYHGSTVSVRSDFVAAPQGSVTGGPSVTVLALRVVHRLLWPCKLQLAEIEKICC